MGNNAAASLANGHDDGSADRLAQDIFGMSYANIVPGFAREAAQNGAADLIRKNTDIAKLVSQGYGLWDSFMNGIQSWVLGAVSNTSLQARNGLFARIGVDEDGKPAGTNPFAAQIAQWGLDPKAATDIQAVLERTIRSDLTGWFGMGNDPQKALAVTEKASGPITAILHNAFLAAHGSPEKADQIGPLAEHAATALLYGDTQFATADYKTYFSQEYGKGNPGAGVTGVLGMLAGTVHDKDHAVAALDFGNARLNQTMLDLNKLKKSQPPLDPAARDAARSAAAGNPAAGTGAAPDGPPSNGLPGGGKPPASKGKTPTQQPN